MTLTLELELYSFTPPFVVYLRVVDLEIYEILVYITDCDWHEECENASKYFLTVYKKPHLHPNPQNPLLSGILIWYPPGNEEQRFSLFKTVLRPVKSQSMKNDTGTLI